MSPIKRPIASAQSPTRRRRPARAQPAQSRVQQQLGREEARGHRRRRPGHSRRSRGARGRAHPTAARPQAEPRRKRPKCATVSVGLGDLTIAAPIRGTVVASRGGGHGRQPRHRWPSWWISIRCHRGDVPEAKMNAIKKRQPFEVCSTRRPTSALRAVVVEVSPQAQSPKATGTVRSRSWTAAGVLPE